MAQYKRAAGIPLSDAEREALREVGRKYADRKVAVHCASGLRQSWEAKAAAKGMSLSAWVCDRVEASQAPNLSDAALRVENDSLRDEISLLRRSIGDLTSENAQRNAFIAEVERELGALATRLIRGEKRG